MSGPIRLPAGGSAIDRSRPLSFRFDGRLLSGFAGDTLASALLANGVRIVGRSFKYHRARGIFAAGAEEPNALVRLGIGARAEPNLKATQVPLVEGLVASSVNCWPSPRFDLGSIIQIFSRILPAGFYYKTFMWPSWHRFEGLIRRAAGLGIAPDGPDPDRYGHAHLTCDLLVVGAGSAGLEAALAAASAGERVVIADECDCPGGRAAGSMSVGQALASLAVMANVTILRRTTVFGYYDHNALGAVERLDGDRGPRQRMWKFRAGRVLLATGAIERPLVFGDNDRPGVMLASAVETYLARYGILCGREVVVFTNNSSVYPCALALAQAGAVVTVVDSRETPAASDVDVASAGGVTIRVGQQVARARGRRGVKAVDLVNADGTAAGSLRCDLIAVSGGWSPVVHLFSQAGGNLRWDGGKAMFLPATAPQQVKVVGAAAGDVGANDIVAVWRVPGPGKAFVDFGNDVTADDIGLAARENYVSVEHLKRYTTLGMGVDQGKTSNVNGLALLGEATGRDPARVGTTKFRPPYTPVALGAIAGPYVGDFFHPLKYLPAHDWHVTRGALFEDHGGWARPTVYPRAGEPWESAAMREARDVRLGVGLFDGSPLGKIEVAGSDAAAFLDRIYVGSASTLKPGRARYGLMLNENGIIVDDGVFVRLAEDRFLVHTTSGGADRIAGTLDEWLQCEWPHLDVVVVPVTTAWATLTLSGRYARDVMSGLDSDIDLSDFGHMTYREGQVEGHAVRVLRASFTGEASYEISVPAQDAEALANAIWRAGEPFGLFAYGIEALMRLRIEKGYLHIGVDTDGTTLPADVGMAGGVAKKTSDFIGRRSLMRPDAVREDRLELVGLRSARCLAVGAHIMGGEAAPCAIDGYVTSSVDSPTLGHPVALALVRRGRRRMGESIPVYDMGTLTRATIVDPLFYDKEGQRLRD